MRLLPGESFREGEKRRRRLLEAAEKRAATATTAPARAGVRKKSKGSGAAATPPSRTRPARAAAAADATVEGTNALDCGVCFLPLKPPIFQCNAGHVMCSVCRDKLKATGKCHVCGVAIGGYSRCHAMEHLVESICFPCPNSTYGCTARTVYHDREGHRLKCLHSPGCCPDKDCGFAGSTTALLDHFSSIHGWPCTNLLAGDQFKVRLNDGFNILHTDHATSSQPNLLFLLKVARRLLGCAISMLCIHPHPHASTNGQGPSSMECELIYSRYVNPRKRRLDDQLTDHYLRSKFRVACMDLPSGLKPPIYQCNVGHVVCSQCRDKLGVPRNCHVCRALTQAATTGATPWSSWWTPSTFHAHTLPMDARTGRCIMTVKATPRHARMRRAAALARPAALLALLRHFAAVHSWPCRTEDEAGAGFVVNLNDGFNFITAVRAGGNKGTTNQYLFLLNVERAPFGRTITAFCIHPHHTYTAALRLTYGCYRSFDMCCTHHQASEFKVACTDLSNGLPDPSECFLFIVPRSACRDDEGVTKVTVVITQPPIQ